MKLIQSLQFLLVVLTATVALSLATIPRVYGEEWVAPAGSSADYTTQMWKAYEAQNYDVALVAIDKCIAQHGAYAAQQQSELKEPPAATEAKEVTANRGPLNDVGTCLLIKGDILLKKGDKAGAKEAYTKLCKEYKYARCWDTKGWFWAPADAAKKKLVEMEIE